MAAAQLQSLRALCIMLLLLEHHVGDHVFHVMAVLTAALAGVTAPVVRVQALRCWQVSSTTVALQHKLRRRVVCYEFEGSSALSCTSCMHMVAGE